MRNKKLQKRVDDLEFEVRQLRHRADRSRTTESIVRRTNKDLLTRIERLEAMVPGRAEAERQVEELREEFPELFSARRRNVQRTSN